MHLMIDLEGLATGPDTTILTIAAQAFDPFGQGHYDQHYYARVTLESQENRSIDDGTIAWWATQPEASAEEFNEQGRISLSDALDGLHKITWHADFVWANGPTYDMNILEHAYKSLGRVQPWQFYKVRDARTIYSLWPNCPRPPTSHHALEDCKRQIDMLQATFRHLNIKEIK
jgi:hypothetical protein